MKKAVIKEYMILSVVLLVIFGVYTYTMFPSFKSNDSPEIISSAYTLGVAHPPGYPLFLLSGKAASLLLPGSAAFRINLLSAFFAALSLAMAYFTMKKYVLKAFAAEWLAMPAVIALAFSSIIWSQAIEAKGGIYMLNLLFFSTAIFFILNLYSRFDLKILYLASYGYGLSLANHWPSMALLAPAAIYLLVHHRKKIPATGYAFCCLFFILGLTPYIYLPVRGNSQALISWGDLSGPAGLWDYITRKNYNNQSIPATGYILGYHVKYFFKYLADNYMYLWLLSLPGIYAVYKQEKKSFRLYSYIMSITAVMLILASRTREEIIWMMSIFMIPAQYILLFLIASGAAFCLKIIPKKNYRKAGAILFLLLALRMAAGNYGPNQRNSDFTAYDMTRNMLASIDKGAAFLPESDMTFFPVMYSRYVRGERRDIKFFPLPFLQYGWGIKKAREIFGDFNAKEGQLLYNLAGAVNNSVSSRRPVYRDFTSPAFDALKLPGEYAGLVKRVSAEPYPGQPGLYELYSYRGIFAPHAKADENMEIITRYLIYISMNAEALLEHGRNAEAAGLYEKALLLPAAKLEYVIYYKIARAHMAAGDYDAAIVNLKKSLAYKYDYLPAYEAGGIIYYNCRDMVNAGKWFEEAVKYGTQDKQILGLINNNYPFNQ